MPFCTVLHTRMAALRAPCPSNSLLYNESLCACLPGYIYNGSTSSCIRFTVSASEWVLNSGVDYSIGFPQSFFAFDQIKKFSQSQAVFLEATALLVLGWLFLCGILRFGKLGDGRNPWFKIRWSISRLDFLFSTRHFLDDQNIVLKRRTELGGAFSVASWMLFIGLLTALIYEVISKSSVAVHNVRAANAPDLASFINDLEFNITTISRMSCAQLRGLGTLIMGSPGFIDYRRANLSNFANYSCFNTSLGPTISIVCNNCPLNRDNVYISWQFVDIPNEPAAAVGFQFYLTARNRASAKHISSVSGIVNNGSNHDAEPLTYRGLDINVLKFNLVPIIYQNFDNLKLVQPLFHEFLPGSYVTDAFQLRSSLQSSVDGFINTTLSVKFLSDYIVEIDRENVVSLVGFLANVGGLYCTSIGIFLFLLVQCEHRIRRLRHEDQVLRSIRQRKKAQDHWDKLRKYVMYTWGVRSLQEGYVYTTTKSCCASGFTLPERKRVALRKRMQQEINLHTISFDKEGSSAEEKILIGPSVPAKNSCCIKSFVNACSLQAPEAQNQEILPVPPLPNLGNDPSISVGDVQKSIQDLYEYNAKLREKLIAAQSMLDALMTKTESAVAEGER